MTGLRTPPRRPASGIKKDDHTKVSAKTTGLTSTSEKTVVFSAALRRERRAGKSSSAHSRPTTPRILCPSFQVSRPGRPSYNPAGWQGRWTWASSAPMAAPTCLFTRLENLDYQAW